MRGAGPSSKEADPVAVFHPDEARPLVFLTKLSVNLQACFFFPEIFFFVAVSALFFILSRAGVCKDDLRFGNLLSRSQKNKGCVHAHEARKEPATSVG